MLQSNRYIGAHFEARFEFSLNNISRKLVQVDADMAPQFDLPEQKVDRTRKDIKTPRSSLSA